MGITPQDKIDRWTQAAGQTGKSQHVIKRVIVAGEFLEKSGRMNERQACECMTGIDFSKPVEVVRLPDKVYVQYVTQHKGIWFTDTGLTPDAIGLAEGRRTRKLFRPCGILHVLKSTARSIKDTWTPNRIIQPLKPENVAKLSSSGKAMMLKRQGQLTSGGGTQYIVVDKHRMEEI